MGTTARMALPYPEATDAAAGDVQLRALAEAVDPHLARVYETLITFPASAGVPEGGQLGGSPITVPFPAGRFTTPPVVMAAQQSLPAGAQWVRVLCTAPTTAQVQLYAYNTFRGALSTTGPLVVAVLAVQRDG